jgi:hypothetical protein
MTSTTIGKSSPSEATRDCDPVASASAEDWDVRPAKSAPSMALLSKPRPRPTGAASWPSAPRLGSGAGMSLQNLKSVGGMRTRNVKRNGNGYERRARAR